MSYKQKTTNLATSYVLAMEAKVEWKLKFFPSSKKTGKGEKLCSNRSPSCTFTNGLYGLIGRSS